MKPLILTVIADFHATAAFATSIDVRGGSRPSNIDARQSSDFPNAQVNIWPFIKCEESSENNGQDEMITLTANECREVSGELGPQKPPSSAVANAQVPKGITCTLKLYKQYDCEPKPADASGPPGTCVTNSENPVFTDPEADPTGGILSALWECKKLPVLTEFPPADITVFTKPKCALAGVGAGLLERTYRSVQPNECLQPDTSLIDGIIGNSVRAQIVLDIDIPIPDGYKCELVLFQGTDCRKTSEYSYSRGPANQCITPPGQKIYRFKGIMWQCGFA
jgi:hypothetical protein